VTAAGEVLMFVEEGGRAARPLSFGQHAMAVSLAGDVLVVATSRGEVWVGGPGPGEPRRLGSFQAELAASTAASTSLEVRDEKALPKPQAFALVVSPTRCWVRATDSLYWLGFSNEPLACIRQSGVLAIAQAPEAMYALTTSRSRAASPAREPDVRLERFRSDDEGCDDVPLPREVRQLVSRTADRLRLSVAADGRCLAIAGGDRIAVSRNGGRDFSWVELRNAVAVTFAGDTDDCPLLALSGPSGHEPSAPLLVEVPFGAPVAILAELDLPLFGDECAAAGTKTARNTRVPSTVHQGPWASAAIAWDSSREVLWIACPLGLLALGPTRRH
jgi:hypothetical protein